MNRDSDYNDVILGYPKKDLNFDSSKKGGSWSGTDFDGI